MATKNNFSKAVLDLMGRQATGETPEPEQKRDVEEPVKYEPRVEPDRVEAAANHESEVDLERKKFLYNAQHMTTTTVASARNESTATVISRSMVIEGEVLSSGDIDVYGDVKGSIKTTGDIKVTGKIIGDVAGDNFTLNGCAIQGNIEARGNVVIGTNTVIVGNISADNIKLNGKVKGNLKINNMAEFLENALLAGDVASQTISMSQGAKLHGNVRVSLDNAQSDREFSSILSE